MKLHWSSRSPYVRKVMICAYELGLADRIERIHSISVTSALALHWHTSIFVSPIWAGVAFARRRALPPA